MLIIDINTLMNTEVQTFFSNQGNLFTYKNCLITIYAFI